MFHYELCILRTWQCTGVELCFLFGCTKGLIPSIVHSPLPDKLFVVHLYSDNF